ncbi:hypothetical protein HIM_01965 [Hirsutella minnesotensis 3608]|nr:hypothetical protein HIM_01965 [Hirsutella minnesotensis 3608]
MQNFLCLVLTAFALGSVAVPIGRTGLIAPTPELGSLEVLAAEPWNENAEKKRDAAAVEPWMELAGSVGDKETAIVEPWM